MSVRSSDHVAPLARKALGLVSLVFLNLSSFSLLRAQIAFPLHPVYDLAHPNAEYGPNGPPGSRPRIADLLRSVLPDLENVRIAIVLQSGPADGPPGTFFIPCPDGSPFAYCLQTHNDGAGNEVQLGVGIKVAPMDSDPYGQYGGCVEDPSKPEWQRRSTVLSKLGQLRGIVPSLAHIIAIDVIECGPFDGPGSISFVLCPAGGAYTYCLETRNDGGGQHVKFGVIEDPSAVEPTEGSGGRLKGYRLPFVSESDAETDRFSPFRDRFSLSRRAPPDDYGICNINLGQPISSTTPISGVQAKSRHVLAVGKSLVDVAAIDLLDCTMAVGPEGTFIVPCPVGSDYAYCLQSQNDGSGNAVELGVVEHPHRSNSPVTIDRMKTLGYDSLRRDLEDILVPPDRSAHALLEIAPYWLRIARTLEDQARFVPALAIYERVRQATARLHDPPLLPTVLLSIGRIHYIRGDFISAQAFLNQARQLDLARGDRSEAAEALLLIGSIHDWQSRASKAELALQQAHDEFQATRDQQGTAEADYSLAGVAFGQRQYTEAQQRYEEAQTRFQAVGDRFGAAGAALMLGDIANEQGQTAQALAQYQTALYGFEASDAGPDSAVVAKDQRELYQEHGYQARLVDDFEPAREPGETMGARMGVTTCWQRIGDAYLDLGYFVEALSFYMKGFDHYNGLGDVWGRAHARRNIGKVYYHQGNDGQALTQFNLALEDYDAAAQNPGLGLLLYLAHLDLRVGKEEEARQQYERLRQDYERYQYPQGVAATQLSLGRLYFNRGANDPASLEQAFAADQDALIGYERLGDQAGIADAWTQIGQVRLRQDRLEEAFNALQSAKKALDTLQIGQKGAQAPAVSSIRYAILLGDVYRKQGNREAALSAYRPAIEGIERLRAAVAGSEDETLFLFENYLTPYQSRVQLLIEEKRTDRALEELERMRARALLDTLLHGRILPAKTMTQEERRQERALLVNLHRLNRDWNEERLKSRQNKERLNELQSKLQQARQEHEAFLDGLYVRHPELRIQRGVFPTFALGDAQALVPDPKTALVEYWITEGETYLFVVTRRGPGSESRIEVKMYPLGLKRSDLDNMVEAVRQFLIRQDLDYPHSPLSEAFRRLLGPAWSQLAGKTLLGIVPDGRLWELPFQALMPTPEHFLIEDAALFYIPSLTVLREMRRLPHRPQKPSRLLAFANPSFSNVQEARASHSPPRSVDLSRNLDPLPLLQKLIDHLERLYGRERCRADVGPAATEEAVKQEASQVID